MKKNIDGMERLLLLQVRRRHADYDLSGLNIIGKNVLEMVVDGEIQYKCLKALSVRYPAAASATLMMALYVEAEAFGSEINYSQNEIPSVSKRLIDSFSSVVNLKIPQLGTGKTGEHLRAAGSLREKCQGPSGFCRNYWSLFIGRFAFSNM